MTTIQPTRAFLPAWLSVIVVVLFAGLFDTLFWDRELGINLSIFIVLVVGFHVQRVGWKGLSGPARSTLLGTVLAGVMVYVHHSAVAMVAAVIALGVSSALAQESRLRSLFYAAAQMVSNFVMVPFGALGKIDELALSRGVPRSGWRWVKLSVLPTLVLLLFMQLYRAGNPKFDHLTAGFMDGLWEVMGDLLSEIFTAHTFFFLFALVLCGGLLFRFAPHLVVQMEQGLSDALMRARVRRPHWMSPRAMDPLERERRMGVILLIAVNVLLAVVNAIDINWVWVGFEVPEGFSLKQFVHEGTWMLIISILLSMLLLMHLFRKNQNFYSKGRSLKMLGLLWIVQNFILGVSVFLRNYHYISFHGLAYKRIGVIVFLVLVLVGLVTLFVKVRDKKSLFYLARLNAWAAFAVLISLATVDWDSLIVRYNLGHWNQGEIDVDNYLTMSDKVLPLLYADMDRVEAQMEQHRHNEVRWVDHLDPAQFRRELDAKRDRFRWRCQRQHWQEVNLADRKTMAALEESPTERQ